ncbi:MAG: hypothetical protein E6Q97_29565 [Desulfurellales bacterium]|nr:MAG: hypothetical protein E6Q97_29565 [Desulfurellales bacterium]
MGYLHIENLYRPAAQTILLFRECYALEKVHGTSAHVAWRDGKLHFFSGGESYDRFLALFDQERLSECFTALGHPEVTVYGEAYGGKQQGMRSTYGDKLRFIAFDVKVGDTWLNVPSMDDVATKLGFEVVPWRKVSTDLAALDAERDRPSEVSVRRGIGEPREREGVVLRPLVEMTTSNGSRVIVKHKGDKFSERATPQKVIDPDKLVVLTAAQAIADEWVTPMRLDHVLQALQASGNGVSDIATTPKVIAAMLTDVEREASGEIVMSRDAKAAIGRKTAELFKSKLKGT